MSARSRAWLSTSCPIVCSRVSSSPAISDFPLPSVVPGCSTSTVAVARKMSGKDIATVAAPAKTTKKTDDASHAWRCRTASGRVTSATPPRDDRTTRASPVPCCVVAISGHDQGVAGTKEERLQIAFRDELVVVARNPRDRGALHAQDHHLRSPGEVVESSGQRDRVEDRRAAGDVVAAGFPHLADHRHLAAANLPDDDRHLG